MASKTFEADARVATATLFMEACVLAGYVSFGCPDRRLGRAERRHSSMGELRRMVPTQTSLFFVPILHWTFHYLLRRVRAVGNYYWNSQFHRAAGLADIEVRCPTKGHRDSPKLQP